MRNKIIEIALGEVGYTEKPGNDNKYGEWFGFNHVAWCAEFVSYCYEKVGKTIPFGGWPKGFAGVPYFYTQAVKNNLITAHPQPGDIVLFDWNGDKKGDHTGIFVGFRSDGRIDTIEGNTSSGEAGSQSNGDGVYKRIRSMSTVLAFVNVLGDLGHFGETREYKRGDFGATVLDIQRKLNEVLNTTLELDGKFGKLTAEAVVVFQKKNNIYADGICGPETLKALGL